MRRADAAKKLGLLATLYFSQGLPYGFFTQAVPVLLRKSEYSLGGIGLASFLALPWALKFLWAPLVDRTALPGLGKRKSWILPIQAVTALLLLALAATLREGAFALMLSAVFVLNLLAATQDIATDGLAIDMLAPSERGLANGVQVGGYRVGMIVGGGALLVVFDRQGPRAAFLAMAALIVVASIPIVFAREPEASPPGPHPGPPPLRGGGRGPGWRLLLLVAVYKAGEAFAMGMLRPFLVDLPMDLGEIGKLLGTVGFASGLLGAFVGGALVGPLGRKRSLVVFGVLQALSVAGYAAVAHGRPERAWLYAACGAEHFASGLATTALFTCMMDWCRPGSSATDYTRLASVVVIATGVAAALSGFSAEALGYTGHFSVASALAVVAVLAVGRLYPTGEAPAPDPAVC